jgi:tetratricopeptide (TPR) repeat protein
LATLHGWLTREYGRLCAEGRSEWAAHFDAFVHDLFAPNVDAALSRLPPLYASLDPADEPTWGLILDYYYANVLIYWQGELGRAIKVITGATVRARRLSGTERFLAHYVHEMLLHAWLEADAPGKAEIVLAAAEKARAELTARDMIARYDVLRSRCLAQMGRTDEALDVFHGALATLDWQSAFYLGHRGSIAEAAGDLDQAASDYAEAIAAFDALGYHIEANGTRIGLGDVQARMGELDDSITTLTAALDAAEHGINRAHVGMAQGALGQVCLLLDEPDAAGEWFEVALASLDGLGWARYEAETAVERVAALKALGKPPAWERAVESAARCVETLQAADLQARLSGLLEGGSG